MKDATTIVNIVRCLKYKVFRPP